MNTLQTVGALRTSLRRLTSLLGAILPVVLLVLGLGAAQAQPTVSCATPPAGLVSWWPAEGTAMDVAGTNNGTLVNGAGFAAGEVGQAFSFNGNLQCVTIPYTRNLTAPNHSVKAWVKPLTQVSDSISQDLIIGQAYGWSLVVRPGVSGIKAVFQFATSITMFQELVCSNELPIGQFSHLVGTWDGATLRVYFNGVLNGARAPGATPVDLGYGFYIGGYYIQSGGTVSYSGQYFNGLIDEPSYYNRALTSTEVEALYAAGAAGKCRAGVPPSITIQPQDQTVVKSASTTFSVVAGGSSPLSYQWQFNATPLAGATDSALTLNSVQPTNVGTYTVTVTNLYGATNSAGATLTVLESGQCVAPPAGLVSWWPAEGTAEDVMGLNPGTLANGAGFGAGEVGQAFSFNGTTQCVIVPYSHTLVTANYSVEAWVKPFTQVSDVIDQDLIVGQAYGWHLVVRRGGTGIGAAFGFATTPDTFYDVAGTSELPIGQFSHLVGTWDGTTLRLYVNGVLNATQAPGTTPVDLGYGFYIGGFYIPSAGSRSYSGQYFNGLIDEPTYYGRALGDAEVAALYAASAAGKCRAPAPPAIRTQPQNQTVAVGASASFTVIASGTAPLVYQWHFNGTNLPGATTSAADDYERSGQQHRQL